MNVSDAAIKPLPLRVSGFAVRLLQRSERSGFSLSWVESAEHQTDRRLIGRSIEITADKREIGVISGSYPFQEPFELILPDRIFYARRNKMSHVNIEAPVINFKARYRSNTIV